MATPPESTTATHSPADSVDQQDRLPLPEPPVSNEPATSDLASEDSSEESGSEVSTDEVLERILNEKGGVEGID